MKSYAIAQMLTVDLNDQITEYLHRIDETLAPYGGTFLVHGPELTQLEGEFPGTLIVIEFPEQDAARAWYDSAAYRTIVELRTGNSVSNTFIADGVEQPHRATDVLTP